MLVVLVCVSIVWVEATIKGYDSGYCLLLCDGCGSFIAGVW